MRIYKLALATLIGLLVVTMAVPVGAAESPRQRREAARAKRAKIASELNALKASDAQLESAVNALNSQVKAQSAAATAARQAVAAAEQSIAQAEAKVRATEAEMSTLKGAVAKRAVDAYVNPQRHSVALSGESLGEATRRTALLGQLANHDRDVIDELNAAREDFAAQQAEASRIRDIAASRRKAVDSKLAGLKKARADKLRLESALSARIADFQKEVDGLAAEEANLSNLIRQREAAGRASRSASTSPADGRISSGGLIWPVRGSVTSEYGYRWGRMHQGIDVAAPTGTPIVAAKAGEVIFAGTMSGYGNVVIVDHGGGFSTLYAHQSRIGSSDGQRVGQGQTIGYVGSTGRSTGPHLHFETRVNGSAQNPRRYL